MIVMTAQEGRKVYNNMSLEFDMWVLVRAFCSDLEKFKESKYWESMTEEKRKRFLDKLDEENSCTYHGECVLNRELCRYCKHYK